VKPGQTTAASRSAHDRAVPGTAKCWHGSGRLRPGAYSGRVVGSGGLVALGDLSDRSRSVNGRWPRVVGLVPTVVEVVGLVVDVVGLVVEVSDGRVVEVVPGTVGEVVVVVGSDGGGGSDGTGTSGMSGNGWWEQSSGCPVSPSTKLQ
jgi:hypothetical protein